MNICFLIGAIRCFDILGETVQFLHGSVLYRLPFPDCVCCYFRVSNLLVLTNTIVVYWQSQHHNSQRNVLIAWLGKHVANWHSTKSFFFWHSLAILFMSNMQYITSLRSISKLRGWMCNHFIWHLQLSTLATQPPSRQISTCASTMEESVSNM